MRRHPSAFYWVLLTAAAALIPLALGIKGGQQQADSEWYQLLAEGHEEQVIQPFASRELEPKVVEMIDQLVGTSPVKGFLFLATLSVLCCLVGCAFYLRSSAAPFSCLLATVLLPVWTTLFHAYLLPDIFYSAILLAFCFLLWKRHYWWAVLLFVPLYVARESTALTLACFCIAAAGIIRARIVAAAVFCSTAGLLIEHWLASGAQGNRHHMGELAYLFGKVPYNFSKNLLGVPFWSNTLSVCTPKTIYALPTWLRFGSMTSIGPCGWEPFLPVMTAVLWLGTFGVLPVLLVRRLRYGGVRALRENVLLRFCVIYGLAAFLIGPLLGTSVHRLVAYGWPAFALALPTLWPDLFVGRSRLLVIHLSSSWFCWLVFWHLNEPVWVSAALVFAAGSWIAAISFAHCYPITSPLTNVVNCEVHG